MSRLENFLGKDGQVNKSELSYVGKRYQCQVCDEFTNDSYSNPRTFTIYWYCSNDHESKVELNVGSR
jgi:hypothetical protein